MFAAMRIVKEIRIMVDALVGCCSLFIFCAGMLAIFLSIFAIFFVQGAASYLEKGADASIDVASDLERHFGTVSKAMMSLFMTCTGGNDWSLYYNIIKHLGFPYDVLFAGFVVMYFLAFFNVVTSVFCEKAISLATPTTSELIIKRKEKEHNDAVELYDLMKRTIDTESTSFITVHNFDDFVCHPEVELYFQVRGCNVLCARKFFKMLCDTHETEQVDFATFISALVKLDGMASSIDAHCLSVRMTHEAERMKATQNFLENEFSWLRSEIRNLSHMSTASKPASLGERRVPLSLPAAPVGRPLSAGQSVSSVELHGSDMRSETFPLPTFLI
jgi:hypothetical protein